MKTLDPTDYNYNGDYTNQDGVLFATAGGFNYHNGPEWVWPLGYFLRALLLFCLPFPPPFSSAFLPSHPSPTSPPTTPSPSSPSTLSFSSSSLFSNVPPGHLLYSYLHVHRSHILSSLFRGLPELTNANGAHCAASCEDQAWSSACILDALHELAIINNTK